ncbi:IS66 family insertion sequence element accessory protein TnpB [Chitinispirillales bacterium ANBcel5]|uniref:IS66 family insertion sequence element accessory protein TnpB n=1 Tax=Cellulosispirillum alkaliphilum TaxID=3039283 RepID=UPI002A56BEDF|nr:IS66 family insertion sequence element accessory protein TnpB [Chitinispirillales bacterium ANBcel5]
MIGFSASTPIYLCTEPCDMRKSFDGLCGLVHNYMGKQSVSENVFVFVNRTCDRMKILHWDRHGFWLYYKRLEQGHFQIPSFSEHPQPDLYLTYDQLLMILEGIDYTTVRRRKRFTL